MNRLYGKIEYIHQGETREITLTLEWNENILDAFDQEFNKNREGMPALRTPRITSIKVMTCMGCLDVQPNQMAHMSIGGCLPSSSQ
jgi:hypothetical protein